MTHNPNAPRWTLNPFKRGDYVRRKPEFRKTGGWAHGDKALQVDGAGKGFLVFTDPNVGGDFYYGYFEKAMAQ